MNFVLRAANAFLRFVFLLAIAKYLSPEEMGVFGIFAATIIFTIYIVGLDFYIFVSREVVEVPRARVGGFLRSQATLSVLLYCIFLPLITAWLISWDWSYYWILAFYVILLLEHINQELFRLLSVMFATLSASFLLILRHGMWSGTIALLFSVEPSFRTFKSILFAWSLGGISSVLFGVWKLRRLGVSGWDSKADWRWIKRGVYVCLPFLISTLALRFISTADRYGIDYTLSTKHVGAYVFFSGIASALFIIADSLIFSYALPQFLRSAEGKAYLELRHLVQEFQKKTIFIVLIFVIAAVFIMPFLLRWVGVSHYLSLYYWFPIVLVAAVFNALSTIPHLGLYALRADKLIIAIHFSTFGVFLISSFALVALSTEWAFPGGIAIAYAWMFILNSFAFSQLLPNGIKNGPL